MKREKRKEKEKKHPVALFEDHVTDSKSSYDLGITYGIFFIHTITLLNKY